MKSKLSLSFLLLSLGLLIGTRLLHLLNSSHYYLINQDSFYFHFQSTQLKSTHHAPLLYSGWTYFLAISPDLMSILLPILASLFTALLLYWFVKDHYSPQAALCTVFCFAICIPAIFIGSVGNVDRDSLELILMIPILTALYYSGLGNRFNFIYCLFVAALFLAVLTYLWSLIAIPVVLILIGPFAVYKALRKETYYRLLVVLILTLGGAYLLFGYHNYSYLLHSGISELQYLDITGLVMYIPLILPFIYGIIVMKRRKSSEDVFLLFWLVTAFITGLMLSRLQLFLIPVVCIVSGIGLYQFYADNKESKPDDLHFMA